MSVEEIKDMIDEAFYPIKTLRREHDHLFTEDPFQKVWDIL